MPFNSLNTGNYQIRYTSIQAVVVCLYAIIGIDIVLTISSSLLAASISSCGVPFGSFLLSCIREVCCLILLSNSLILACLQWHYHLSLKKITPTVWSGRQQIGLKIINTVSIYIVTCSVLQYGNLKASTDLW